MIISYIKKTEDLVFHKPHSSKYALASSLQNIEVTPDVKTFGVILSDNLSLYVCS
jgi:hypothetical protein